MVRRAHYITILAPVSLSLRLNVQGKHASTSPPAKLLSCHVSFVFRRAVRYKKIVCVKNFRLAARNRNMLDHDNVSQ